VTLVGQAGARIRLSAALGVLVAGALLIAGCSDPRHQPVTTPAPEPDDPLVPCSYEPPKGQPGDAPLLFTLDVAGLVWVIYADGSALTHREASEDDLDPGGVLAAHIFTPYDDGPGVWDNAYLAECDLQQLTEAAEEFFAGEPDVDQVEATDTPPTILTYYGREGPQSVRTLGMDASGGGLTPGQQEDLAALQALVQDLETSMRSDGTTAPVQTVQVETGPGATNPPWPAPPLEEVLTDGCGVYTGSDAVAVARYLTEQEQQPIGIHARSVPPRVETC